jgi:hypothetical protein
MLVSNLGLQFLRIFDRLKFTRFSVTIPHFFRSPIPCLIPIILVSRVVKIWSVNVLSPWCTVYGTALKLGGIMVMCDGDMYTDAHSKSPQSLYMARRDILCVFERRYT